MAERRRRSRSSRSSSGSGKLDEGIPLVNKKQILGFFIILFSFFIILSIVSFSGADQSKFESLKFLDIFRKEQISSSGTYNWFGLAGVFISGILVKHAFGFFSLLIPGILGFTGLLMMLKKPLLPAANKITYLLLLMLFLSSFAGLLKLNLGAQKIPYTLSGTAGDYFASILYGFIGIFAGYIFIIILVTVTIFLMLDSSLAETLARLKLMFENFKKKYTEHKEMKRSQAEIADEREEDNAPSFTVKGVMQTDEPEAEEEEHIIKDTKINRPLEDSMITETKEKAPEIIESDSSFDDIDEGIKIKPIPPKTGIEPTEPAEDDTVLNEILTDFRMPTLDLLDEPLKEELEVIPDEELKENGKLLQAKLLHFGIKIEKVFATPGPVVTLYELVPAEDVKLSRIESLQDDIALAMKAKGIRMIIPIPGKGTVGVEIPNHKAAMVKIKSVVGSKKFNDSSLQLPIGFGKTISGEVYIDDLAKMPHLLIAGSTGSGKSVGINTIITSLLYKLSPNDLKFLLIDPKKIELNQYSVLKNHYLATSKDYTETIVTTPQNSVLALKGLEIEMEKRYERLANATVRNITDYNKKFNAGTLKDDETIKHSKMPYIVVIIDELADLMITAAREVEEPIARLAQLARAVGIHLILATQRPSVDVITGVIKANFSARIAYLVNSKVDSRTILDMNGAEQLLGLGDMLYLPPGIGKPSRIQNPYISVDEVERITAYISKQKGFTKPYQLPSVNAGKRRSSYDSDERDELFEEAARLFIRHGKGSTSMLQRRLKVGYARAARIVDELELAGVVGPGSGSKEREVLIDSEAQLDQLM